MDYIFLFELEKQLMIFFSSQQCSYSAGVAQRAQNNPECDNQRETANDKALHPSRQHHKRRGTKRCGCVRLVAV